MAFMSPKLWLALGVAALLAFSGFFIYRAGKANTQAKWDAEKLVQTQKLAAFNEENRRIEQRRQALITEAQNAAKIREIALRRSAAAADSAANSLRDELAAARSNLSSASCETVRGHAEALNSVFGQCVNRYRGLAETTQGIASDALMLDQAWPR